MPCDYSNAVSKSTLGNATIRRRTGFQADGEGTHSGNESVSIARGFYQDVDAWAVNFNIAVKAERSSAWEVGWYGHIGVYGHCDDAGTSWHKSGRAWDLTRIRFGNGEFVDTAWSWNQGLLQQRRYLAVAAHLRKFFKTVLTAYYNSDHHDHIHFDNGDPLTPINDQSKADTQIVQLACNLLGGQNTTVDGVWGSQTENNFTSLRNAMGLSCRNIRSNLADTQVFLNHVFNDAINNVPAQNTGGC